ncbi:MAG: carbohydrate binding domain-containing protein [Chthoniobacterales bacterium]
MSLAGFALPRYLLVLLLLAAAYPIGRALLRRLTFASLVEELAVCITMGLGILSHLILVIGMAGWLNAVAIPCSIAVVVTASLFFLPKGSFRTSRQDQARWPLSTRIVVALCCVVAAGLLAPALLLPLYPPTYFDVISYHLAAPKMWLQAHAIIPTPFLRNQLGPNAAHVLFAALMLARDDLAPQILSFAAIGLVAAILYGWGKRAQTASVGVLAAALWIGSPAALEPGPVSSYHALAALFAAASIYALATYAKTRQRTWLFTAAAFMGFAQSTWVGAFYFVPVFAAAALYFTIRERRLAPLLMIAAGVVLGWGPSLLRSAWYTGNPTYPLFPELFGPGPWWKIDEFPGVVHDIQSYGVARTLKGFLSLPYALVMEPEKFQSQHGYSIVLSALLPFVILRAVYDKLVRWLLALFLYYVGCWFVVGQLIRYLVPIVPVLCLATALTIGWLLNWSWERKRIHLRGLVSCIAAVLILLQSSRVLWQVMFERGPVPQTTEQRVNYITARIPEYKAVAAANAAPGPLYSTMLNVAYYVDGLFMGDWWGPGRYQQFTDHLGNADALYDSLHRLGAVYFLADQPHTFEPPLPYGDRFDAHFEPVYADSFAELYRLHESPEQRGFARRNLLENGGFDELNGSLPVGWNRRGAPIVERPPGGAASGEMAVRATDSDGFQQFVKVVPGEIYELEIQAKADVPGRAFRLQINWIAADGNGCDVFLRAIAATPSWRSYTARVTAPQGAERCEVYATGHGTDSVWLDSFAFRDTGYRSPFSPAPEAASTPPPVLVFRADPNPVPAGPGLGTTTIIWDTGSAAEADVFLVTGDKETIFGRGAKISQPAAWIQPGSLEFRMYSRPDHKLLAKLTVTRPQLATASASPTP